LSHIADEWEKRKLCRCGEWVMRAGKGALWCRLIIGLFLVALAKDAVAQQRTSFPECPATGGYCVATGDPRLSYYLIGREFVDKVAPATGLRLDVIETNGSIENIERMRYQRNVKLAIVQSDVILHLENVARANPAVRELIRPLRVVAPLYDEEIHVIARIPDADPSGGLHSISQLKGRRIAVGPKDSGMAMTGLLIYQGLFGELPSDGAISYLTTESMIAALRDQTVDAAIIVSGQPVPRLAALAPEARGILRLLPFERSDPAVARLLQGPYYPAAIRKESYRWLERDLATLSVKAYLISQVYTNAATRRDIEAITRAFCRRLPELQASGHLKWRQVTLGAAPLPGGWLYSADARAALDSDDCRNRQRFPPSPPEPPQPQGASQACQVLRNCP